MCACARVRVRSGRGGEQRTNYVVYFLLSYLLTYVSSNMHAPHIDIMVPRSHAMTHSLCAEVDIAAPFLDMHLLVDPGLPPLQVGVAPGWPHSSTRYKPGYA